MFRSGRDGAVLIAASAATYQVNLGCQPIMEECERAHVTLARLSELQFQVACSSSARPNLAGTDGRLRWKWGWR